MSIKGVFSCIDPKNGCLKAFTARNRCVQLYTFEKKAYRGVDWCILAQTGVSSRIQGVFNCINPKNGSLKAFTTRNRCVQLHTVEKMVYRDVDLCKLAQKCVSSRIHGVSSCIDPKTGCL